MYFTSLPDHNIPGFDESAHFSSFQQKNIIFNAASDKSQCERHVGCLSIKTVTSGEEWYVVDGRRLAVRPGQFLILNNDQQYSSMIDANSLVRVQSVFFRKDFASAVFRDANSKQDDLLDNPFDPSSLPEFFQTLDHIDPILQEGLHGLMNALDENGFDDNMVDERLLFLLRHLIQINKIEIKRSLRVDAIKQSTKMEVFKRLCVARDLLHSSFMGKPDLSEISQAACLSTPQLIRQFKIVFNATPHQYLVRLRLSYAARLLQTTSTPVHEITWRCGFQDTSAFCRAFKTEFRVAPLHYRVLAHTG